MVSMSRGIISSREYPDKGFQHISFSEKIFQNRCHACISRTDTTNLLVIFFCENLLKLKIKNMLIFIFEWMLFVQRGGIVRQQKGFNSFF